MEKTHLEQVFPPEEREIKPGEPASLELASKKNKAGGKKKESYKR